MMSTNDLIFDYGRRKTLAKISFINRQMANLNSVKNLGLNLRLAQFPILCSEMKVKVIILCCILQSIVGVEISKDECKSKLTQLK